MPPRPTPIPVTRSVREIGQHLATWRKLRGVTQGTLAERAGVSRATLHKLESGQGHVTLETFLRVLRVLGTLDLVVDALDPYQSDVGRLRADQQLPERVRPRRLAGGDDA